MTMWRRASRISDEELDWAIRLSLRAEVEGLEPSPDTWRRIRARIQAPSHEPKREPRRILLQRRAALALQGALLVISVLGIGLSFNQGVYRQDLAQPTVERVTRAEEKDVRRYPDDALTMGRLIQIANKPAPGAWRVPRL